MLLLLMLLSALAAGQDSRPTVQSMLPRLTRRICGCPLPPVGEGVIHMTVEGDNLTETTPRCRRGALFYTCQVKIRIFNCQCVYQRWVPPTDAVSPAAATAHSFDHGFYWACTGSSCWYEGWTSTDRVPYAEVRENYRGRVWRFRLPFDE